MTRTPAGEVRGVNAFADPQHALNIVARNIVFVYQCLLNFVFHCALIEF